MALSFNNLTARVVLQAGIPCTMSQTSAQVILVIKKKTHVRGFIKLAYLIVIRGQVRSVCSDVRFQHDQVAPLILQSAPVLASIVDCAQPLSRGKKHEPHRQVQPAV